MHPCIALVCNRMKAPLHIVLFEPEIDSGHPWPSPLRASQNSSHSAVVPNGDSGHPWPSPLRASQNSSHSAVVPNDNSGHPWLSPLRASQNSSHSAVVPNGDSDHPWPSPFGRAGRTSNFSLLRNCPPNPGNTARLCANLIDAGRCTHASPLCVIA